MGIAVRFCTVFVREEEFEARAGARSFAGPRGLREGDLVRWVCQSPAEGIKVVKRLEAMGFRDPDYVSDDIAVVDEQRGLLAPCPWLDVVGSAADGWEVARRHPGGDSGSPAPAAPARDER